MSCREAVRRLWRYLDGELDDLSSRRVEEHLEHCVVCCGELEFVGELQHVLASQQVAELSSEVQERLESFLTGLTEATTETSPEGDQ
ncbi:MAG: anti-sigma factor family protein [Jiangellaceae bacterium]